MAESNLRLKSRIVRKFGTIADFAEAAGEHASVVSMLIRGRRNISNTKKIAWAMKLNCKPKDIFQNWQQYN